MDSISFYLTTPKYVTPGKFHAGGAELSAYHLGNAFRAMGIKVRYYCNTDVHGLEGYYNYGQFEKHHHDVVITVRAGKSLFIHNLKCNKLILWTGDAYDQPNNVVFNDINIINRLAHIVFKSQWQLDTNVAHYGVLESCKDKTRVIYNGVNPDYFNTVCPVDENLFICTSRIFRGIDRFTYIWPSIKACFPKAKLMLYPKIAGLYSDDAADDKFKTLYKVLSELDGITVYDNIPQQDLIKKMTPAFLMLYPNFDFVESSCGSAMEAMCTGTPIITSKRAGLIETVGLGEGRLIDDELPIDEYTTAMINYIRYYKNNPRVIVEWNISGKHKLISQFKWDKVAHKWLEGVING